MKRWLSDGLHRLADWVFPPRAEVAPFATWAALEDLEKRYRDAGTQGIADHEEIQKLKKNVENLSLLVGFHRGIQTPGGRK